MLEYELTRSADDDLLGIAVYTIETWGLEQLERYEAALVSHFEALGRGEARTMTPIKRRPKLLSSRCEHHYVFSLQRDDDCPLILAVLGEKMDLMVRLRERLAVEDQAE